MARKRKSLGLGFADEIAKVTSQIGYFKKGKEVDWVDTLLPNFQPNEENSSQKSTWRIVGFSALCLMLFFITFLRLFHLQIVEGKTNRDLADGNRIQVKIIHAPRGVIYDRNGQVLAANSPGFRLNDPKTKKTRLINREQALEWEVKNDPRFSNLEVDNVRTYPHGEEFAHVIGFTGEISAKQIQLAEFKKYRSGDIIGQVGIEAQYEKILRGKDGGEIIEVDSLGNKLRTLRMEPAVPGKNVYLSIDAVLQKKLYQQLKETLTKTNRCCAAAVALDPNDGKILALVSLPSFDPNIFSLNQDDGAIGEIFSRTDFPILNRVIGGTYPPASTFKIITAMSILTSGISPTKTIEDTGVMYLGPYQFTNWYYNQYGKTEGLVNLYKALKRSNDTYFYKISHAIGEKAIADWAEKLYLGKKLGIDLPGEETGLVPDNDWKQKTYKQPWYPGDTLHMSIGQGFMLATPLQVLGFTSYIAADGILYKPALLLSQKPAILATDLLTKEHINVIKKALELVPKQGGTAWPFFNFPITTAGKTGTAEYGDPKDRTHAWYTAYAPVDKPKIVLTVLVEGGGEGSSVAAPIVKEAFRYYLSPDKNKLIQDIYTTVTDLDKTLGE